MNSAPRTLNPRSSDTVARWVRSVSAGMSSAIELGCGYGNYLADCAVPLRVGVDSFLPYIERARERVPNATFHCGDMREWRSMVNGETFDLALLVDSIEHIPTEDALTLIESLKAHVRRIAMFLPLGLNEQEPCDGNDAQRHVSFWHADDLRALGFAVQELPRFHAQKPVGAQSAAFAVWNRP